MIALKVDADTLRGTREGVPKLLDALGAANAVPTIDEDGDVCLHAEIEPYEDEATRDACIECGEKFRLRGSTAKADEPVEEELFYSGVAAESVAAA